MTEELGTRIMETLTHDLATENGQQRLASLDYSLIVAVIDVSSFTSEITLTTEGPEGTCVLLSLGN
jgi:hypothetical protein